MQKTTVDIKFASPKRYIEDNVIYKKKLEQEVMFLSGNEACAYGAIKAGLGFYAGYPITPSTEIAEILSGRLPAHGKVFIQMEDEIASMGAIIGASLAGLKSMTATSGPGFSLMQENLGYACMAEVPCVVVNVQRGGPSTGLPTSPSQSDMLQARWGTHGEHPIIAIYPTSIQETFELIIRAFNLAEKYRTPVIFLMDEVIGHMREKVVAPLEESIKIVNRKKPEKDTVGYQPFVNDESDVPSMASFGEGYRFHVTGLNHDQMGFPTLRKDEINAWFKRVFAKIDKNLEDIITYKKEDTHDMETLIISYGISARSARAAKRMARQKGKRVGLLVLHTIWPFPEEIIRKLASKVNKIIVPELNRGQIKQEVERAVCDRGVEIKGVNKIDGDIITPGEILKHVEV